MFTNELCVKVRLLTLGGLTSNCIDLLVISEDHGVVQDISLGLSGAIPQEQGDHNTDPGGVADSHTNLCDPSGVVWETNDFLECRYAQPQAKICDPFGIEKQNTQRQSAIPANTYYAATSRERIK